MNRFSGFHWKTFLAAPVVMAAILAALWLAVMAAHENVRFARATDQVLGVIAIARNTATNPAATQESATADLLERLSHFESMRVRPAENGTQRPSLINSWGRRMEVEMLPFSHQLRVQTSLSPAACRRMILFYAKDAPPLGVQRVEVNDEGLLQTSGRMLYGGPDDIARSKLDLSAVNAGCGESEQVALILTIRLQ